MSDDALSNAGKAGRVMTLVDAGSGGALSELREMILPDVEKILQRQVRQANDDVMVAVEHVVRILVGRAHGVEPSDPLVTDFINGAAANPSFAARTARLLSQAVRTPNLRRRRMLALALFCPHADASIRDEVDAAIEGLEPTDVELLRRLIARDSTGAGFKAAQQVPEPASPPTAPRPERTFGQAFSIGRTRKLLLMTEGGSRSDALECSVGSVLRLRAANCIDLAPSVGTADFVDRLYIVRRINLLPLARDVLDVFKEERAYADIEQSVRAP